MHNPLPSSRTTNTSTHIHTLSHKPPPAATCLTLVDSILGCPQQ